MARNHYNRKIFNSVSLIACCTLVAKVVSALKDLFVAAWLGAGESVDAFLLGALIPLLSVSVFATPYASSIVPVVTRFRVAGDERGACSVFEVYLRRVIFPLIMLTLGVYLFAHDIAGLLAPENGTLVPRTTSALRIMAPLVAIAGLTQILVMVLGAFESFALPALTQIFSPIAIILALKTLPASMDGDALAIGAVIGNLAQLITLLIVYLRMRVRTIASADANNSAKREPIWQQWAPLLMSALLMSSTDIIDQIMAAWLGIGAVATLSFGTKVSSALISILAGALASAAFPYLSQMIERKEAGMLSHTLFTYTRLILICSLTVVAGVTLFSDQITRVLFERGLFTSADTVRVSLVQQMAILQLPFYLLNTLYMRVIIALRIGIWLSLVTIVTVLLNVILNLIFANYFGVAGIALSTSCAYLWSTVALGMIIIRKKISADP